MLHVSQTSGANKNKVDENQLGYRDDQIQDTESVIQHYADYSRPGLSRLLKTLKLQQCYERGLGNHLYYKNKDDGSELQVLDALGGFGACIFGHNYEPLVNKFQEMLLKQTPFLAQGSTRVNTAILGKTLSDMLERRFHEKFVSITLNTGADAVEAAIKHSEMVRGKKLNTSIQKELKNIQIVKKRLRHQTIALSEDLSKECQKYISDFKKGEDVLEALSRYLNNLELVRPTSFSVKRGYHGKTTGALQLTYGESYRSPFMRLGPKTDFIDPEADNPFDQAISDHKLMLPKLHVGHDELTISFIPFLNVNGLFVEPLQGEGGIRPLSQAFLQACRDVADAYDIPLIFDEIQSGMGRTGSFLYCEQKNVNPDVVLLSKSLGGGLAKISVTAIKQSLYDPDFDELHSSTFAEDDLSAGIAVEALRLIDEPELLAKAKHKGSYLKAALETLRDKYPETVETVRGEGLFLGFVFKEQKESESFVIRFLSENGLLGYVVAGYLLNEHGIRIGTTLSDSHVLRIEPSIFISQSECDELARGIERSVEAISKANAYELSKYLVNISSSNREIKDFRGRNCGRYPEYEAGHPTVTFVATPASALHVMDSDESLKLFKTRQVIELLAQIVEVLGPVETETRTIVSRSGKKINFRMLVLMYDPVFISKRLEKGYLNDILENIIDVQKDSESLNHSVLGLGSYTSIVSHNGIDLTSDKIAITTGNALTVGMGARAILKSAQEHNLDIAKSTMAVLGAGGNIGSVYSEFLADYVPKLVLIGRENRLQKLHETAKHIYSQAHELIRLGLVPENSIASQLQSLSAYQEWSALSVEANPDFDVLVERIEQNHGESAPIVVTSDMKHISTSNLLLTCSNAPTPIVFPNMIGDHKTIICDVSVPQDVSDSVATECANVELIRGGLVRLPKNPEIEWLGNQCLGHGVSYACMAETMLMGLEGSREHGSYGKISKQEVNRILDVADSHGFELAKIKVEKVF